MSAFSANVKSNTFEGAVRSGHKLAYAGVQMCVATFSFDPTQVSAGTGIILPAGIKVYDVTTDGGATGGASPTVDIGTSVDDDAFAAEQAADARSSALVDATLGASWATELTDDTEVFAGVGASAATGGTVIVIMQYYYTDDGTKHNT